MRPIDPVRGPELIPRTGKLPRNLLPEPYEVMVLRSPANKMVQLERGCPPTMGQRFVGGFTEAYYVDTGSQTRTFSINLPTADVGIDLAGEVDVELMVDDCCEVVRERRGDLAEQLGNWCYEQASRITSEFSIGAEAEPGLAAISRKVADALRVSNRRPELFGLSIRELRVRLRFVNESTVMEAGATALSAVLAAKTMQRTKDLYERIFGPEFARVYAALQGHEELIPQFVERFQAEQQLDGKRKWDLFTAMLNDSAIELHIRERFTKELGNSLLSRGDKTDQDFARLLLERTSDFELTAKSDQGNDGDELE